MAITILITQSPDTKRLQERETSLLDKMSSSIDLPPAQQSYFRQFLKSQFMKPISPPKDLDLSGHTGIITGSNSGIGLECARVLLSHTLSRIILAVRSTQKGEAIAATLRRMHPGAQIEVWALDLLSYDSILAFTQRCTSLERIDFVVLNAGSARLDFRLNDSTGHEETFQVNYLSTALLTLSLLPVLKDKHPKHSPAHLSLVSSGLVYTAKAPDADPLIPSFDDPTRWNLSAAAARYSVSKLLGQMFVAKLKDSVNADEVVVNLVDPGFMKATGLDRHVPLIMKPIIILMRITLGRSVQAGAWTYVDAAAVKGKETHGSFLYNWTIWP